MRSPEGTKISDIRHAIIIILSLGIEVFPDKIVIIDRFCDQSIYWFGDRSEG
jgi:hypothetical protein